MKPSPSLGAHLRNGLFGGVVGGAINVLLLLMARLASIAIDLPVGPGRVETTPLTWWATFGVSLLAGVVAGVVLVGLNRLTEHGWGYFVLLAGLVLLLSMVPILVLGAGVAPRLILALMHLIAAAAIVGALAALVR